MSHPTSWIEQLLPIIAEYKDGSDEPLDGDEVDRLCHIIKAKINLHEGNITEAEYEKCLDIDPNEAIKKAMAHYISNEEDEYDAVITALEEALNEDPNKPLEYVEEVLVWEKVEGKFTVSEFCELIGIS